MEKNCSKLLVAPKSITSEGDKLYVMLRGIADISNNFFGDKYPYIMYDYDDEYYPGHDDDKKYEKFRDELAEDKFALVNDDGKYDVYLEVTKATFGEYLAQVLLPAVDVTADLEKSFETIYSKCEGVYDAAERLSKKVGVGISESFPFNKIVMTGIRNVINEVFSKFCKEHKEGLKIKNRLAIVSEVSTAPVFLCCSYLYEKGARLAAVRGADNLFTFHTLASPERIQSGFPCFTEKEQGAYAMNFIMACVQDGIGVMKTQNESYAVHVTPSCYAVTEDEIEDIIKINRKIDAGTFKYTLYPAKDGLRMNSDGSFSVNINLFYNKPTIDVPNVEEEK